MNIPTGKCPGCGVVISHVELDSITAGNKLVGPLHRAISYRCPSCRVVLSVEIDPIALKRDTVDEILEALGKPRRR